ncbi:hypothetical protein [Streptomyces bohaiensis]|uniref:Uncharacterized protein n=1 Tax=Streptomyces bohaiensis TaxID=1431344 RepID=A0ABX1CBQ4_9ACTN|nr:hypothetical protein [Streptomyces bohaiensis]NJQ15085.1 hypothetical protein [Streptomyces bohaiensis]
METVGLLKWRTNDPATDLSAIARVFPGATGVTLGSGLHPEDLSPLRALPHLRSVTSSSPHPGTGLPEGVDFSAPPAPRY